MLNLKLSVVLCTYNGVAFLPLQLDSLLAQTRLPDEVLVGDDGSTDASVALLEAFATRAHAMGVSVHLVRQPRNLGYVANFSDMLVRATGEVIFLCDQDDYWHADKLAMMAARFAAEPDLLLLCSNARLVDAQGQPFGATQFDALELTRAEQQAVHQGRAFDVLLRRSMVTGATTALRREVVQPALPVGQGWVHDEWLAIVVAALGRMDVIEQPLIDYRQHGANQIGMRRRTLGDRWRDLARARGAQFRAEVARLRVLEARLAALGDRVRSGVLAQLAQRRKYFQTRVAMGRLTRWHRLPAILREARQGSYARYGTGYRSMLRDWLRHD